jgi:hypothetical protein
MLRWARDIYDEAVAIVAAESAVLRASGVPGELVWTGGSSVQGALTRGDVDLHLRVAPDLFENAVELIRRDHVVVHPEIWCDTLATFAVEAPIAAGLAVTPIGSEHDFRFIRSWHRLRNEPLLLAEYNDMKLAGESLDLNEYESQKAAFFTRLVTFPRCRDEGRSGL